MRRNSPGSRRTAAVHRHATFTVVLVGGGDRHQRAGGSQLLPELVAARRLLGTDLRHAREAGGVARDAEDTPLEGVRAVGTDPQVAADLGDRDAVACAHGGIKRQRPLDRSPAAARGVARKQPDRAGSPIAARTDECRIASQNQRAAEPTVAGGDLAGRGELGFVLPRARCITAVQIDGAVARVRAEIPDHEPRA